MVGRFPFTFLRLLTFFFRIGLSFGHPFMIDVHDCDARLPSSGDPGELYMDELVRLSVILGKVMKTIYRSVFIFIFSHFFLLRPTQSIWII
jgi:hypothetical protein